MFPSGRVKQCPRGRWTSFPAVGFESIWGSIQISWRSDLEAGATSERVPQSPSEPTWDPGSHCLAWGSAPKNWRERIFRWVVLSHLHWKCHIWRGKLCSNSCLNNYLSYTQSPPKKSYIIKKSSSLIWICIKHILIANKFAENRLYWLLTKHSFFTYFILMINLFSFFLKKTSNTLSFTKSHHCPPATNQTENIEFVQEGIINSFLKVHE